MTYETFKRQLAENLQEHFSAETNISIRPISRNNHIILDGLTILEPESNISPTIYLNHYYTEYQNGTSFSSIQEQILHFYYGHCSLKHIDTSFFTNFDNVRSRIVCKLIHCDKNKELLKEVPYFPYLDLAIVFYCLVAENPYENASIPIYNEHLEYWHTSKDTLLMLARENTPLLLPFCCDTLADLILPVLDILPQNERPAAKAMLSEESVPMYVITNKQHQYGACCILYQDALKKVSEQLNDNLYILPSSVHEVIILPASAVNCPQDLPHMVRSINMTEVSPEEILSDCVYYYNKISCQTSILEPDNAAALPS